MTELKVDTIIDAAGTGKPNFSTGVTVAGAATSTLNLGEYNASSSPPSNPENGSIWWDTSQEVISIFVAGEWKTTVGIAPTVWYGDRGIYHVGETSGSSSDTINYSDITSTSNASDFGNLSTNTAQATAAGSNARTIFKLGLGSGTTTTMEYITPSSLGNATDFGDTSNNGRMNSAVSDGTYMLIHGGNFTNDTTQIEYVTVATTSNTSDFGNTTVAVENTVSTGDATRAIHKLAHGGTTSVCAIVEYTTISSPGNATDFGDDLTSETGVSGFTSGGTSGRAVMVGGNDNNKLNNMTYWTIQTLGNSTNFGDLTYTVDYLDATSNYTRGIAFGGRTSGSSEVNTMNYWTFDTTGNASDYGDLAVTSQAPAGGSGSPS